MLRRDFLNFLGKVGVVSLPLGIAPFGLLNSCSNSKKTNDLKRLGIEPSTEDNLILIDGLDYEVLCAWGDSINNVDYFGYNNDYTAFIPIDNDSAIFWVNHEYPKPLFVSGYQGGLKTKEQVDKELYNVGGSILKIKRTQAGKWKVVKGDKLNKRITGHTKIPFYWDEAIFGKSAAMGTLGNCSGGVTPWGTILTCEENYDAFYGEAIIQDGERTTSDPFLQYNKYYDNPPEHYGWVVEVNPLTGESKKLVALGRFMHECATIQELDDGRLVVYTGDDTNNQCLYKFISDKPGSLKEGKLYVASLEQKKWLSLDINDNEALKEHFKTQTQVQIRTREAAHFIGATPLDRPEDIDIDPITGDVFISLTNNKDKGNAHGSILKLHEKEGDKSSLEFDYEHFLTGGPESGFTCPDNLAFDKKGNLWFTTDMSGYLVGVPPYESFGNNGLFVFFRSGPHQGQLAQIASAPVDAELTGPTFSPDGKTLFLSVQHPGEYSKSLKDLSSDWPDKNGAIPKPAVVSIQGPFLDSLV